ncbi:MAG: RNA polymerase sigma factor [Patescibacteria group bacterium]|nr:RNA polymerase sigma factor [Patescibacteria group bacterium]
MEEFKIIERILNRDERALYEFYIRYKENLLAFIRRKVEKESDCEEILQDTFFAFLESLRDFHGKSSIKTFLFSICNHKIVDYYRRKKLKHIVFSQLPQLEQLISPLLEPEEAFDESHVREKISRVFSELLPRYREILIYKYIEGRSVDDIARILRLSFKSAESRLFRARKAFVKAYERCSV